MPEISWDFKDKVEGIVDTGIIVIAHFTNPIKEKAVYFLSEVLKGNRPLLIPLTTFVGAYHILTRYLKVPHAEAKIALATTLRLNSEYFFPVVDIALTEQALDFATVYNVESWDGYLIALAYLFETRNIYTIDRKLRKISQLNFISPINDKELQLYHQFLQDTVFSRKNVTGSDDSDASR